jgi:Putative translation initiation inhibitor, yjgF family
LLKNAKEKLMKKEIVQVKGLPKSKHPFSHVVKAGCNLYLTSQLSCDLITGEILKGSIKEQTRNALENIKYLLENANSSMQNIVDVTIYIRKLDDFSDMNNVYKEYFKSGEEPARVVVKAESPLEDVDIEIKVTALINDEAE